MNYLGMTMKKTLITILILFCQLPSLSLTLEGKVISEIRQNIFYNTPNNIDTSRYALIAEQSKNGYRVDYNDGSYSVSIGKTSFVYNKFGDLVIISLYDKSVFEYPRMQWRYSYPSGKMESASYGVSEGNGYVFNPGGSLRGVWDNFVFYKDGRASKSANMTVF